LSPEHPAHGQHLGILLVELGVGITVCSAMLMIFYKFALRGKKV
jgi:multicomponent Na+:H+ antiporter subunit B